MPAAEAKHGADYNMACYRGLPAAIPERLRNYLNSVGNRSKSLGNYATVPEFPAIEEDI
jgi:hypothetical protein